MNDELVKINATIDYYESLIRTRIKEIKQINEKIDELKLKLQISTNNTQQE